LKENERLNGVNETQNVNMLD